MIKRAGFFKHTVFPKKYIYMHYKLFSFAFSAKRIARRFLTPSNRIQSKNKIKKRIQFRVSSRDTVIIFLRVRKSVECTSWGGRKRCVVEKIIIRQSERTRRFTPPPPTKIQRIENYFSRFCK